MHLEATRNNLILKVLSKTGSSIITVPGKGEAGDFCEIVDVGPCVEGPMVEGMLVLRPVGISEWHDESTDEVFLVVKEDDIVALGVDDESTAPAA